MAPKWELRRFLGRSRLMLISAAALALALAGGAQASPPSWPTSGATLANSHANTDESVIGTNDVASLAPKWTLTTYGDVSSVPTVANGVSYFTDWGNGTNNPLGQNGGGWLTAASAKTGTVIWREPIASIDPDVGLGPAVSRTSPAVANGVLYLGDQNGAHLMAVNAGTGALIWRTQLDAHPMAIITASPLVANGVIYEGVASVEEAAAINPAYPCCTFRGSIVAIDAMTGGILWKTYAVPDNGGIACTGTDANGQVTGCGYSGGAVWGSTGAYDPGSNTLFVGTGNNYTVPDGVKSCEANGGSAGTCLSPDDHVDSLMALNASTGQIKWATGVQGFDDWNVACIPGFDPHNCPANAGPDYDFGSGPQLLTIKSAPGKPQLVVGGGQKSGEYWELDATTGAILWSQAAGPGSSLGGIEWGSATDGKRIYIAEADPFGQPYTLPNGQTINYGSWAALDPATGSVIWQVPVPDHNAALGFMATANGVVYAPSMGGHMYALDAATGNVLWSYSPPGAVIGGASIVGGQVFWGSGYAHLGIPGWNPSTTFYSFTLKGK